MELNMSKIQEEIIFSPEKKIVVLSAAGSGKTFCITERVRFLLKQGVAPTDIAAITFTNNAADTMISRLGEDFKQGLFIGTIHSLANYFLLSSGINTNKYIEHENFDELFNLVKDNIHCVKHYKYVLLDEAQDSDDLQFDFIFNCIQPENFFIVGDPRQCIYQWKGSNPNLIIELTEEENVKTYNLNENYRNGKSILNYAKRIIKSIGLDDNSVAKNNYMGMVQEIDFDVHKIINILKNVREDSYNKCAILTRTNAEIDDIVYFLEKNKIPFDTFKQAQLTNEELKKKMEENTIKVLTIHSAKGLEWDNVIVIGARFYPSAERNVSYVAATRAKLNLIWTTKKKKKKTTYNWE